MNSTYTTEELELIRDHEAARLNKAQADFQAVENEMEEASAYKDRWEDPEFISSVTQAKQDRMKWVFMIVVIAVSFLMNCLLIQELTGDFAPLVGKFIGLTGGAANFVATLLLTSLVFSFLLTIKDKCETESDFAALRVKSHPAVSLPIRRRLTWKLAVKIGYLVILALGYHWLYSYIAGGVMVQQQIIESAKDLAETGASNLSGTGPDLGDIDADLASTQAASFAFYYCVEWLLHAAILFLGHSYWAPTNLSQARASQRRDGNHFKEVSTRYSKALSKLRLLCEIRNPDDGMNELRQAYKTVLKDATESSCDPSGRTFIIKSAHHGFGCSSAVPAT